MNLSLPPEVQSLIDRRVRSGQYSTVEDVVTAALATLDQHERMGDFKPGELDRLLAAGERSIEQAGTIDGEEALARRTARRAGARDSNP